VLIRDGGSADEQGMSDPLSSVAGADLSSSVGIAVARKALEAAKSEGSAAVSLIRAAGAVGEQQESGTVAALPGEPGARFDTAG
jgi:hypothetical protein